jgi:hypothetical protein
VTYALPDHRHFAGYSGREASSTFVLLRAEIAKAKEGWWVEGQWGLSIAHLADCQVDSADLGRHFFCANTAHASFLA